MVIEDAKGYLLVRTNLELLEAPDVYIVASHCFANHILLVGLTQSVGIVLHDAERRPRVWVDVATSLQRCVGDVETSEERDVEEHDASGLSCVPPCHQPLLGGATILAR